jgi:hypothetical protein
MAIFFGLILPAVLAIIGLALRRKKHQCSGNLRLKCV